MMTAMLYDIIFLLPLAVSVSLLTMPYYASDISEPYIIICTVISCLYLLIIKHVKRRRRLLAVGIAAAFFAAFIFLREPDERLGYISDHTWVIGVIVVAILCLLIRAFVSFSPAVGFVAALALFLPLPLSLAGGFEPSRLCVLMIFMYCITTAADLLQRRRQKSGDTDPEKHIVFIFPFILAVAVIAAVPKIPEDPYNWGFVRKMADGVQNTIASVNRLFTGIGWDSDSPFIGFSDNGKFGGDLVGGSYTVMDLTSSSAGDPYLYLAGRRYDTFDGKVWSGDDPDINEAYFDSIESMCAAIDCTYGSDDPEPEALRNYVRSVTMTVNKNRTGSERTFAPSKQIPAPGTGTGKSLTYLRFNTASPEFDALFKNGHAIDEKTWDKARGEIGLNDAAFDHRAYEGYVRDLKKKYLPETTVSERAGKYIDDIVCKASDDHEKLVCIEAALGAGRYSDSPGDLPDSLKDASDYLDYFLFEKQEGYCSYYASAFVLMSRYCGIPSRLVQGYRCSAGSKLHLNVMSDDAHAWAESYIEGIGWMVFEPTPGMKAGSSSSDWIKQTGLADYYSDHYKEQNAGPSPDAIPESEIGDISLPLLRIMIPTLFGIFLAALLFVFDILQKRRRYNRSDDRTKALWMCRRSMQILKKRGYAKGQGETLAEYRLRLSEGIAEEHLMFLESYEKIMYSDLTITPEDVKNLETSYDKLRRSGRKIISVHDG